MTKTKTLPLDLGKMSKDGLREVVDTRDELESDCLLLLGPKEWALEWSRFVPC